jgi:DNA-binding transcriptional regulator YdaS (Cro superfamily)
MKTIEEVYRARLHVLIKEAGNQAKLAKLIGKSGSQISQWINGSPDSKTGKPRAMSREIARAIERTLGKPTGWMDQPLTPGQEIDGKNMGSAAAPGPARATHSDENAAAAELLEALETIRLAIIRSDISGSKALVGVFASFVDEPENTIFRDSLVAMLAPPRDKKEALTKAA